MAAALSNSDSPALPLDSKKANGNVQSFFILLLFYALIKLIHSNVSKTSFWGTHSCHWNAGYPGPLVRLVKRTNLKLKKNMQQLKIRHCNCAPVSSVGSKVGKQGIISKICFAHGICSTFYSKLPSPRRNSRSA